jgi:YhcH/YjgK/YiaL family protein
MILDELTQWRRYAEVVPGFRKAFEYLETLDVTQPDGRYLLEGNLLYCDYQRYRTRPAESAVFEAHRHYVDIQYLVTGCETILWSPLRELTTVTQPYQETGDYTLYAPVPTSVPVRLRARQFAILFPTDGHAARLQAGGPDDIVKAVIKVRIAP